jgi:tetratricopeptide (TPR) repeat protein
MKNITYTVLFVILSAYTVHAENSVTVIETHGDVHVRYGVEENWYPATPGLLLRDIDTIMTGEGGEVILQLQDGRRFILGRNSVLDIADLRFVMQKELFLYLTTQKVKRIELPDKNASLRIGNVSVVHGENRNADSTEIDSSEVKGWTPEFNGARALYKQKYFPNAVIKLHKILERYVLGDDSAQIYFYIGKSLEALKMTGQAIDAYQFVVDHFEQKKAGDEKAKLRALEAREAIKRLQN